MRALDPHCDSFGNAALALAIARVAHGANREIRQLLGEKPSPAFENLPDWHQHAIMEGVWYLHGNPEAGPIESHEHWMETRRTFAQQYPDELDGADVEDHPCMVPWLELPEEQRRKDLVFHGIVRAMLKDLST